MTFESTFPWLWALLFAGFLILNFRQRRANISPLRLYGSFAFRSLVGLSLLLAYANPVHTFTRLGQQCILFLVDQSASISEAGHRRAFDFIRTLNSLKRADDTAGLIAFAGETEVSIPPTSDFEMRRPATLAQADVTDITGAIESGLRTFPSESIRTIVLFSDGNENVRDARALIETARQQKVRIHTVPLERHTGLAWGIEKLFIPSQVNVGERFRVRALMTNQSNQPVQATLIMRKDGQPIKRETGVLLPPGATPVTMDYKLDVPGVHAFDLQVIYETGVVSHAPPAFIDAAGMPHVLIVSPERTGRFFGQVIQNRSFLIDEQTDLPDGLEQFLDYDCIILNDVPRTDLSDAALQALQTYVQDFGGGLVTIGGGTENSLEAFAGTRLEDLMPVELAQRHSINKKRRDFALMLLIDRSGSMDGEKIEMAKAAAINAIKGLEPGDSIGIIAFDDQAHTLVDLTVLEADKTPILDTVRRLTTGGGTDARHALVEAFRIFSSKKINIRKHLILMTDGITTQRQLLDITRRVAEKDVTISTIAIGEDANIPILEQIRQIGQGAFHLVTNVSQLPRIVVGDMGEQVKEADDIEEKFIPEFFHPSPILTGIKQDDIPSLKGYVASTLKIAATKPLMTNFKNTEDPILAHWYYGLGRSTAMMTGVTSAWSDEWIRWKNFGKLWEQIIRWTMRTRAEDAPYFSIYHDGNRLHIQVEWGQNQQATSSIKGTLRLPDEQLISSTFNRINNTTFEGTFAVSDSGMAQLALFEEGRDDRSMWFGRVYLPALPAVERPSEELDGRSADYRLLQDLSHATNGLFDPLPREVIQAPESTTQSTSYRNPLLILAMILFLSDVALQRLTLSREVMAQQIRLNKNKLMIYLKKRYVR